jgi:hypothetical protein
MPARSVADAVLAGVAAYRMAHLSDSEFPTLVFTRELVQELAFVDNHEKSIEPLNRNRFLGHHQRACHAQEPRQRSYQRPPKSQIGIANMVRGDTMVGQAEICSG